MADLDNSRLLFQTSLANQFPLRTTALHLSVHIRGEAVKMYVVVAVGAIFATNAHAQCPVNQFKMTDLEKFSFSEALTIAAIDNMEESIKRSDAKNFNLNTVIKKGVPLQVDYKDMNNVANYLKRDSSFDMSYDVQLNYFRSRPAFLSDAYRLCVEHQSEDMEITIPDSAYKENVFPFVITWRPKGNHAQEADARISTTNANVDEDTKTVKDNNTVSFNISRKDETKSITIVPTVAGIGYQSAPAIVVPPILAKSYTTVLRRWPDPNETDPNNQFQPLSSGDAGSGYGNSPTRRVGCIHASPQGILLLSTVTIQPVFQTTSAQAVAQIDQAQSSANAVCVEYGTSGQYAGFKNVPGGHGQHEEAHVRALSFAVREVLPYTSPGQ